MLLPFDGRFAQLLHKRLLEDVVKYEKELGNGAVLKGGAETIAVNCAVHVGLIRGLNLAIKHMGEIDAELNGRDKKRTA